MCPKVDIHQLPTCPSDMKLLLKFLKRIAKNLNEVVEYNVPLCSN